MDRQANNKKKSKGVKQRVVILIVFFMVIGGSAYAVAHTSSRDKTFDAPDAVQQSVVVEEDTSSTKVATPDSSSSTGGSVVSQNSDVSMAEVNAKLCNEAKNNALEAADFYRDQYAESHDFWIKLYKGAYSSPAAEKSREEYISFTKNQFADYVSRNSSSVQTFCQSSVSLSQIMIQPNYTMWQ